ncbi:MAG: restriction endonuclease subunit S [Phycisphaera sp.]|nr:MAG: restriction endonuclease subunit S [Phycisphaera sp.]
MDHSELESRWDPNFYRCMREFHRRMESCPYPIQRLRKSLDLVQYGSSDRASEVPEGLPMLRMLNLQDDTWDISDLKYIEMSEDDEKRYLLRHGDILFNRTNSKELVGKCGVFELDGEYVFASYLIRVRLKPSTFVPHYVTAFLSSGIGRLQIEGVSRQIAGMTNVNAEEIRDLLIPNPGRTIQEEIVRRWQDAVRQRDQTLEEAKRVLAGIDDVLLGELGVPLTSKSPNTLERRMFLRAFSMVSGKRIDPNANWKSLSFAGGKYQLRRFRDVVDINPPTSFAHVERHADVSFVPMDAVSEVFGDVENTLTRPVEGRSAYTKFQDGDIIWAKITPCMQNGKAALLSQLTKGVGYGSTEFHVFRVKDADLRHDYLHHLLRLQSVRDHARLFFTGSAGQQRVDAGFFHELDIPLPPASVQGKIAKAASEAQRQARQLVKQARIELDRSKRGIEALILGQGD